MRAARHDRRLLLGETTESVLAPINATVPALAVAESNAV
jgi:hypothetical protein